MKTENLQFAAIYFYRIPRLISKDWFQAQIAAVRGIEKTKEVPFFSISFPNAYLLAKFGFDTAENEPCEVCPTERIGRSRARMHG